MLKTRAGDTISPNKSPGRFLRLGEVMALTGIPKSTIYAWMAEGKFPPNVKLGARVAAWPERDIVAWQEERIAASQEGRV